MNDPAPTPPSDTPRTDARLIHVGGYFYASPELCRQLERELSAQAERVRALTEALREAQGCFTAADVEGWSIAILGDDVERIRDIWNRRIHFAWLAIDAAIKACESSDNRENHRCDHCGNYTCPQHQNEWQRSEGGREGMTTSAISDEQIAEWRKLRHKGYVSAVGEYTPEAFWEVLDALEQARSTLRGIAEGTHVIVPKEPTPNMIRAGSFSASDDGELENWRDRTRANAVAGYKAMLAAAPKQETLQTVLADALAASTGGK